MSYSVHDQSLCRKESEKLDIILDSTVGRKWEIRQHNFGLLISAGQAAGGAGPVLGQGGGGPGPGPFKCSSTLYWPS